MDRHYFSVAVYLRSCDHIFASCWMSKYSCKIQQIHSRSNNCTFQNLNDVVWLGQISIMSSCFRAPPMPLWKHLCRLWMVVWLWWYFDSCVILLHLWRFKRWFSCFPPRMLNVYLSVHVRVQRSWRSSGWIYDNSEISPEIFLHLWQFLALSIFECFNFVSIVFHSLLVIWWPRNSTSCSQSGIFLVLCERMNKE